MFSNNYNIFVQPNHHGKHYPTIIHSTEIKEEENEKVCWWDVKNLHSPSMIKKNVVVLGVVLEWLPSLPGARGL